MLELDSLTTETRGRIQSFFEDNPHERVAYPCGHDDICDHIATYDEAAAVRRGPRTTCPGCGSNLDRERFITRGDFMKEVAA